MAQRRWAINGVAIDQMSGDELAMLRNDLGLSQSAAVSGAPVVILPIDEGGTGAGTSAEARANLGLGSGDAVQFTTIELGHASDTTLSRPSAGDIAVEGNIVYRASGNDVAVADGGTGASTAAGARTNLGLVIGTDVQAYDADLTSWAGIAPSAKQNTITQGAAVADAAGGATVDAEARTAINTLLSRLRAQGLIAT